MIIDVQSHIMPLEYSKFFEKHASYPTIIVKGSDAIADFNGSLKFVYKWDEYSPEASIKRMDENGIDLTLLSAHIPDCTDLGELAAEGAQIANNEIQKTIEQYPGRYKGIGFLPWNLPDKAIDEAQRIKKMGFVGVMLCSQIGDGPVDLPVFWPVYEELARLGLIIFLHPTAPPWGSYVKEYAIVPMLGFMFHESVCLLRLISSGIMEKNPGLKVVMPHCGGILPYLAGRIWNTTVNLKKGMENITIPPVEMLKSDQIYYDLVSPSPETMKFVANFLGGAEKLMFATDAPYVNPSILVDCVKEAFPDADDQEQVFSGTAKKLIGL